MANELQAVLQALTAEPRTEHPFLSVYIDWRTDSSGKRQAHVVLRNELDQIARNLAERNADASGFEADRERITAYLEAEAPRDARGLVIFACDATNVWAALPLHMPVETYVAEDRYPHVFHLARMIDDFEPYAVVMVEGQEARIYVIALNQIEQVSETGAEEQIRRVDVGGWSQRRFQSHVDYMISSHMRDLAAELGKVIQQYDVEHVVIAGNDAMKGAVMDTLPDQIKAKLVDYISLERVIHVQDMKTALEPLMREVEQAQEERVLAALAEQMATKGGLAAAGVAPIARALSKGQVQTLLLLQDFSSMGGECPACGMLYPGQRNKCPIDGTPLEPANLREAFVARAVQQGSEVQIVASSDDLARHEGVAALLRYRDDAEAAQAVGG